MAHCEAPGRRAQAQRPMISDIEEFAQRALGQRVRAHRKLRHRRLRELAQEAGCSESLLSRIENGLVMPSLSTLHRIARALGVNVATLVADPGEMACTIYDKHERPRTSVGGTAEGDGSVAESLVPYAENRRLEALIVSLPVGGPSCGPFEHDGEEVGLVLEGELELIVEGVVHLVPANASFFFHSNRLHSYRNVGAAPCRVVWVNTPPTF
jgi:transcriptional regulator with XRE-family HTH domain